MPHRRKHTGALRFKRTDPVLTRGPGRGLPARGAFSRCPGGSRWQEGSAHARECEARGSPAEPTPQGARGSVRQVRWRRFPVQAPEARVSPRFWPVQSPEVLFSSQKCIAAWVSLGLAPVLAPGVRFLSTFRYRSVEEDVTNAREVGCMEGDSWHARKLLGSTSPL